MSFQFKNKKRNFISIRVVMNNFLCRNFFFCRDFRMKKNGGIAVSDFAEEQKLEFA